MTGVEIGEGWHSSDAHHFDEGSNRNRRSSESNAVYRSRKTRIVSWEDRSCLRTWREGDRCIPYWTNTQLQWNPYEQVGHYTEETDSSAIFTGGPVVSSSPSLPRQTLRSSSMNICDMTSNRDWVGNHEMFVCHLMAWLTSSGVGAPDDTAYVGNGIISVSSSFRLYCWPAE